MKKDRISLIVPVYDVERYLPAFIDSILGQTYEDIQIIFVDDGSSDRSAEIIKAADDPRILLIQQENRGLPGARNRGIEAADGEFIMFADPDDRLPEYAAETLHRSITENDADLAVGIMETFEFGERRRSSVKIAAKKNVSHFDKGLLWSFTVCNKMFRSSVIDRHHIRFNDVSYCEDGEFLFRYLQHAGGITGCDEVVYHYIKRNFRDDASATQKYESRFALSNRYVLDSIKAGTEACIRTASDRADADMFLSELYRRMVQFNLIYRFYRNIWLLDRETYDIVMQDYYAWIDEMSEKDRKKMIRFCADLFDGDRLIQPEEIARRPFFSIIVDMDDEDIFCEIADNLYSQKFPRFEIITCSRAASRYIGRENMIIADRKDQAGKIRGDYVMQMSSEVLFSNETLMYLWKQIDAFCEKPAVISLNVKYAGRDNIIREAADGEERNTAARMYRRDIFDMRERYQEAVHLDLISVVMRDGHDDEEKMTREDDIRGNILKGEFMEKIRQGIDTGKASLLLKIGIAGALIILAGDMLMGWGVRDTSIPGIGGQLSPYLEVSDTRMFWASVCGFAGVPAAVAGHYVIYKLMRPCSRRYSALYAAGTIGFLAFGGAGVHVSSVEAAFFYKYMTAAGTDTVLMSTMRFASYFLLPLYIILIICWSVMVYAHIRAVAGGHSPYPRWCVVFSMLPGTLLASLAGLAGNHEIVNALMVGAFSLGNIWTLTGHLLMLRKACTSCKNMNSYVIKSQKKDKK